MSALRNIEILTASTGSFAFGARLGREGLIETLVHDSGSSPEHTGFIRYNTTRSFVEPSDLCSGGNMVLISGRGGRPENMGVALIQTAVVQQSAGNNCLFFPDGAPLMIASFQNTQTLITDVIVDSGSAVCGHIYHDSALTFASVLNSSIIRHGTYYYEGAKQISDRFASFQKYTKSNWDGYGADPISKETMIAASDFLNFTEGLLDEPEIAPGSDGTIGFEWLYSSGPLAKLFIDIGVGRRWTVYWRKRDGTKGNRVGQPINKDVIETLIKELK